MNGGQILAMNDDRVLAFEVSARELGHWLGLSERHIRNLASDGVFERTVAKRFPLKASVTAYCERIRRSAQGRAGDGDLGLTAERTRLAKEQADGHELKNSQLRGELVNAGEVERAWRNELRRIQAEVLALSSKIQTKTKLSRSEVALIDKTIRKTLTNLAIDND